MANDNPTNLNEGRVIIPITPARVPVNDNNGVPFTERGHHVIPMTPLPPPDKGDK